MALRLGSHRNIKTAFCVKIIVKYIIIVQSLKKWHKIVDKIVCVKKDYAYKKYTHIDG